MPQAPFPTAHAVDRTGHPFRALQIDGNGWVALSGLLIVLGTASHGGAAGWRIKCTFGAPERPYNSGTTAAMRIQSEGVF